MPGARKTRRLEAEAAAADRSLPACVLTSLPDVLLRYVFSHLAVRCFFRAARTCRAIRDHTLHPSASPHSVVWDGETRGHGRDTVPESLLRLRPRELSVGSAYTIFQRQIDAICARMGGGLRALIVNRAHNVSMAGFSVMAQLQRLHVNPEATVTGAEALGHLTRLTALHVPIHLMDIHHVPESCREITVDATDVEGGGRRAAWLQVLQRPLTALTIGDGDARVIADIGSDCRTLQKLDMQVCGDVAPLAALPLLTELRYVPDLSTGTDDGLGRLTKLRRLDILGTEWVRMSRVGGLECLSALVNLTDLRLDDYATTAADIGYLCAAARCTALTTLDLHIDDRDDEDAERLDIRPLSALSALVNLGVWSAAALRRGDLPHPLPRLERLVAAGLGTLEVERAEVGRMYPALGCADSRTGERLTFSPP